MTVPECFDRVAGERLFAEPNAPDLASHLAACEACRVLVERTHRMSDVWRKDQPDPSELAAVRSRLAVRRGRRGRSRVLPLVVAFAVMLGGAGALAAARVISMREQHATGPVSAPVGATEGAAPSPARASTAPAMSSPAAPSPSFSATENQVPTALLPEPLQPSPRALGSPAPGRPARIVATESSAASARWATAAEAMRAADYAGAERAFDDLARSSDPRTRDEARLARAQVLAADGRSGDARTELESLARSGATPLVRVRAADALRVLGAVPLKQPASGN